VGKKTPDYTKQARRSSGRPAGPARRHTGGQTSRAPQGKLTAAQKMAVTETEIPKYMLISSMVSIVGGLFIFIWGLTMSVPGIGADGNAGRSAVVASLGMLCGLVCNLSIGALLLKTYDRRRYRFGGISMRNLIYAFVGTGVLAFVIILSWGEGGMMTFGLALAPAVVVFYFVLKPRLKALAVTEGRYKPSSRERAREEYEQERAELKAEKERYKRLKAARLGTGKAAKPATAGTSAGRKAASSGDTGSRKTKGR
jgi:hypothetical protein